MPQADVPRALPATAPGSKEGQAVPTGVKTRVAEAGPRLQRRVTQPLPCTTLPTRSQKLCSSRSERRVTRDIPAGPGRD